MHEMTAPAVFSLVFCGVVFGFIAGICLCVYLKYITTAAESEHDDNPNFPY